MAKTWSALVGLLKTFLERRTKKTYLAVMVGSLEEAGENVVVDEPIGRHPLHRQRMRVVPDPARKNSSRSVPNKNQWTNAIMRSKKVTAA